ncbi:PPE family protein [Mycobacterium sp. URHB0044]|uniref:PPE family protein n=1 Tax=Mycobacterium sp. URHB0044 TaxID=1380386 RepID=UPI000A3F866B|nr:PPE family protein [Mycobacterium sp. URHB0044]
MSAVPAMMAMFYGALPPEVNTARLMAGAGPSPMLQAAAAWETLAISLETQAEELAGSLVALQSSWQGGASERAVTATTPMVVWLRTTALQAQKRAMQAIAQANAYTMAMVTTPPLPEIEMNHVTHAVLEATNFLGVNAMPIGINEADYFVRMWNQAAFAMEAYQAETSMNTVFEPIAPAQPIVMPGVGESGAAMAIGQNVAMMGGAIIREATFAEVAAQGSMQIAAMTTGSAVNAGTSAAQGADSAREHAQQGAQQAGQQQGNAQQGVQMATQMASQMGSMAAQVPQTLGQMVTQPVQQMSQPLQQVTQIFSQMGSGFGSDKGAQMGLIGASPMSNHPLAGGSGATSGAGLVRAASLPGMGGSAARTPLMSSLVGQPIASSPSASPVGMVPGAAAGGSGTGAAPVNNSGGAGGGPMAGAGHGSKGGGGSRTGLLAPTLLPQDLGEDEEDDW